MEQKKNKKKIFIIIAVVLLIAIIFISILINNQSKWKNFETCKTDKFEIKYNKNWNMTDNSSEFYGKNFVYKNNKIEY